MLPQAPHFFAPIVEHPLGRVVGRPQFGHTRFKPHKPQNAHFNFVGVVAKKQIPNPWLCARAKCGREGIVVGSRAGGDILGGALRPRLYAVVAYRATCRLTPSPPRAQSRGGPFFFPILPTYPNAIAYGIN